MADNQTRITERLIKDANVTRAKLNVTVEGKAVIRKIIAGAGIKITSTGIDPGTGDVTIYGGISEIPFEFCVSAGVAQTETIDLYVSIPYSIKTFITESDGTLSSVSIKIDGVPVSGLDALSVSTLAPYTATALNSAAVGQRITMVIGTAYSGTPTKIRGKLIIEV